MRLQPQTPFPPFSQASRETPSTRAFDVQIANNFKSNLSREVAPRASSIANRAAIYRSLPALRGRNRKKVSKRVVLGVSRKVSKNTRKGLKIPKNTQKGQFSVFLDFFGYFLRLFSRPPKRPFLRLFCDFGPGGPEDSCKWRFGSQEFQVINFFSCRGKRREIFGSFGSDKF